MSKRLGMPTKKQLNIFHGRDADEDECMACGRFSSLHRAHIYPLCAGGTNDPQNIHLLCPTCHKDSEFLVGEAYRAWFEAAQVSTDWSHTRLAVARKLQFILEERGVALNTIGDIREAIKEFVR